MNMTQPGHFTRTKTGLTRTFLVSVPGHEAGQTGGYVSLIHPRMSGLGSLSGFRVRLGCPA